MKNGILILADDPAEADALEFALGSGRADPFDVERARRLCDGLQRLGEGGIDAIVVNLSLPDSSGIATFDQLFAAAPLTPIMTLSAMEHETSAMDTIQRGAQGNLSKGNFGSNAAILLDTRHEYPHRHGSLASLCVS